MTVASLSVWVLLGWTLVLGAAWGIGTAFLVARALLRVQRIIATEVKDYLSITLEDHRHKAAEQMGQDVQGQLAAAQEELSTALANLVKAEDAQDLAETATQAKTDFLSRMSHEIRTPINGIIGSLDLLDSNYLSQQQNEDLQRAVLSANRLMVVVNEVLDLAKIEADEVEFQATPFDLVASCQEAVDSFIPIAKEKGLGLNCWVGPGVEVDRVGDQQKIYQVMTNLLSNAVKFTDQGQVKLSVHPGHGQIVIIEIEDSGKGISKEQQNQLFQPFSAMSADGGGSGLGLSICQAFVEGMDGSISVSSELNIGTTFRVELPLPVNYGGLDDESYDNGSVVTELGDEMMILSVDDDDVNRRVLERHLEQLNCQVTSVKNGIEAVSTFTQSINNPDQPDYDLVLMDLLMPEMDGFQATTKIRRLEQQHGLEPIKIVALTASVADKVEDQCRLIGMDDFLTKPFKRKELAKIIRPT